MIKFKHTYILLIVAFALVACKSTKYVPEDKYLLKKVKIIQQGDKLDKYDIDDIVRQKPNYKRFGVKWKLMAYNLVDSTKVAEKRIEKNEKLREKNRHRLARQDRINSKRMDKASRNGKEFYTQKIIPLKDTINPNMFFREWYKYKIGHPPIVFDSIPYEKTLEQFDAYLRSRGYYYGAVAGMVKYKKHKKCVVTYHIETNQRYYIDSVSIVSSNQLVKDAYSKFLRREHEHPLIGKPFDSELLDDHRYEVARYMRNQSLYGFSLNNITFRADTNKRDMTVDIGVQFGDRIIKNFQTGDSVIIMPHTETYVNKVYFHIADTTHYDGHFKQKLDEMGLPLYTGQFLTTIDTTYYTKVRKKKSDELDVSRMAIFMHNGKLHIKPKILELQNYLEMDEKYSEKGLENTYLSLLQLDLFDAVKTELVEIESSPGCVDAHYYIVPKKKQSFGFEPRATNSNGFLGVAATVNYINRNLFRGAEKLTMSLSGGFESQPPIFDETIDGEKIKTAARSFNTFEIGPSTSLDLPGLFPLRLSDLSKRLRPKTIISTAYNFQKRTDFVKGTFQMNYIWRFFVRKTMIFQSGLPGASVVKFVNINKTDNFEAKLLALNDQFLLNAYSNQFIWQDWKFTFEYNIKEKENREGNSQLYFVSSFDPAGNIFSLFKKYQDTLDNGQHAIRGVGYAQFSRFDNELIFSKPLGKDRSINFHAEVGAGIPYGNTTTSLPYDYSFFAGGANDNRGWRARELGPGAYKYYLDTNRSATQIGDMRLGASAEFRFAFNSFFKGALFVDAGNVWTMYQDDKRPGGYISSSWYKEIALAAGTGIRMDLEYFIIRVDLGIPIYNPVYPDGSKWIFQPRTAYYKEAEAVFGSNYRDFLPLAFVPKLHFGIGYPF